MPDKGTRLTDKAQAEIERRLRKIYKDAQKELIEKLDKHNKRMNALDKIKRQQLESGQITPAQYKSWLRGQMFTGQQWKNQVKSLSETLLHANEQANAIVEGKRRAVFGENAIFQSERLKNDLHMELSFDVYDSASVTRLLRDRPELLPRRKVDKKKDRGWNQENIADAVTQGIIQGDSIPEIAKRIASKTSSKNEKAMVRYARTAMTGAQNAGRMEALHEAQDMGIKVKKVWLATLDSRTRHAHALLDGQTKDVDEPFESEFGPIMYPGDLSADPANIWNCRCTLIYKYEQYTMQNAERRDQENDDVIEYKTYQEWKKNKQVISGSNKNEPTTGWRNANSEVLPRTFDSDSEMFEIAGYEKIKGKHTYIEDLWLTNPDFDPYNTETSDNCQRCILAYVARRRGFDVEAQRIYNLMNDSLAVNYGWKKVFEGDKGFIPIFSITDRNITGTGVKNNIIDAVKKSDNGAIFVVDVEWKDIPGTGHVFIAENHNGETVFLDPQNPAGLEESLWERILPRGTRLFRVDDKPFNARIFEGVKSRND